MSTPTVDRYRYPFRRMVPGDAHTVHLHWAGDTNVSASTFEVVMLDAFDAAPVTGVTYVVDDTDAATGVIVAVAPIPDALDTTQSYEIRVLQDGETIIAGPVAFAPSTIPVVTP